MIDKTEGAHKTGPADGAADLFAGVSAKRPRLLSGGLAAAPILASMEVLNALAVDCLTPSGNLSGNVSHTQGIGTCTGLSRATWSGTANGQWPGGGSTANTNFHTIFQSGANANFGTSSLRNVVDFTQNTDPQQIGAYFATAYLNARDNRILIPGMSQAQVIGMLQTIWGQWVSTGFYQANATTQWNGTQIKFYLTSNGLVGT